MLHAAATVLMIGSAIAAAACCLGAGRLAPRAVPWQARQSAVVMALGMIALCAGDGDARVLLLVAVVGVASAMLGVVGTRGLAHAGACFHRALGCVVMAVCALAMLGAGSWAGGGRLGAPVLASGHVGHGALVPMSLAAAAGVVALLGLMLAARMRRGAEGHGGDARDASAADRRGEGSAGIAGSAGEAGGGGMVLHRAVVSGPMLVEAEGVAMAISLVVMAVMVLLH